MNVFTFRRKIEFSETDMAGIAHFTCFFKWVEAAEAALYETIDVPLASQTDQVMRGWPRVKVDARFKAPVHFGDIVEVELRLGDIDDRRISYRWTIYQIDKDAGLDVSQKAVSKVLAARGELVTCYVERPLAGGTMVSAAMPAHWRNAFEDYFECKKT